ncbi:DUF2787 family protein [Shewanella sp.]|uniref:DUF2787 family protein n=1 Tax=Shewanella sp. TaxID=50422 RepID=UPI003568F6C4
MDFDFNCKVFQNMVGVYGIKSAVENYQVWESNFLSYWLEMDVFTVTISPECLAKKVKFTGIGC